MRNLMRRTAVLAGAVALLLGTGIGVAAAQPETRAVLTFTPASHAFGNTPGPETFTLANTGDRNSGGVHVTLSGSAEFTITATTCRGNLHPGETCTVTVTFAATSDEEVTATLEATGNPHTDPGTAALTGGTTPGSVNCTTDPAALRTAIDNALPGAVLAVTGTCTGPFTINKDLTIEGTSSTATLNGNMTGGVLRINGVSVTLDMLTITNGSGSGGVYNNRGAVTLNGSTITGNRAGNFGGGIYNLVGGTVTLNDNSTVTGNTTSLFGGGIFNSGTVILKDSSRITGNTAAGSAGNKGGGIYNNASGNASGTVILNDNSTITGNEAGDGGGIYNAHGDVTGATATNITNNNPNNCAGTPVPGCED